MTEKEYREKLKAIDEDAALKRKALCKEYCFSNNPYTTGDLISNHAYTIRIEKIKYTISSDPCCVYEGHIINRNGTDCKKKDCKGTIYQSSILTKS